MCSWDKYHGEDLTVIPIGQNTCCEMGTLVVPVLVFRLWDHILDRHGPSSSDDRSSLFCHEESKILDVLRRTTCCPDKVISSERMVTWIVMHRHFAKGISVEERLCCCSVVIDFVSKTTCCPDKVISSERMVSRISHAQTFCQADTC